MRLSKVNTDQGALILLDNYGKIQGYLEEMHMEKCNPKDVPITTDIMRILYNNADKPASEKERTETPQHLGKFNWVGKTTHLGIKLAHSLLAAYAGSPVKDIHMATDQVWHWLQGVKDCCLVVGIHAKRRRLEIPLRCRLGWNVWSQPRHSLSQWWLHLSTTMDFQ